MVSQNDVMWKNIWYDPVGSKVISGVILAAAALIAKYSLDRWPVIGIYISQGFAFVGKVSQIPNWLTGLLVVLSIPTVLFGLLMIWQIFFPNTTAPPNWQTYTSDIFFGLRWRWRYFAGRVSEMNTFCPQCDFQVFPENASSYDEIDRILFRCDSCHRDIRTFEETYNSLENKATRFAQQKLRQGTWQSQNETY